MEIDFRLQNAMFSPVACDRCGRPVMHLIELRNYRVGLIVTFCTVLLCGLLVSSATAAQVDLTPSKDASLYSYDHGAYDPALPSTYPKADGASHLHVGDTNKNNGLQRGLIQFDLSGIPSAAMVTDVNLTMTVAGVPFRVLQRDINFWMVAMEGLSQQWSQGPGSEQSPAVPGDATWFHTQYDPTLHGELGNTSGNEFQDFPDDPTDQPSYWPAPGYFGHDDLANTEPGLGAGGPFDDAHALVFQQGTDIGAAVDWSNARMISDVQSWIDGTNDNFGWIMIGEEWITAAQQVLRPDNGKWDRASSKIDFYSSDTADEYNSPPILRVTYLTVPGDANGDFLVDEADAAMLGANWQRTDVAPNSNGDLNGDGRVDDIDATILAANWQATPLPATVPEASVFVLLASGLAVLFWRRRK